MNDLEFYFTEFWDMGKACGDDVTASNNPAPATTAGIYIIHNKKENTTYVGYAENAKHRWATRYEVFHCLGIATDYGKNILCAFCVPEFNGVKLTAKNNLLWSEHILIRAVVKGLLGVTTNTNSTSSKQPFIEPHRTRVRVYLDGDVKKKWGRLDNPREVIIPAYSAY